MLQRIGIIVFAIILGVIIGYCIRTYTSFLPLPQTVIHNPQINAVLQKKQVIGFLPYWLLNKASKDYSHDISTLTYFGLPIDSDGSIQKLDNPQELQPGWNALQNGSVDPFFRQAKNHHMTLSLLIDSGDTDVINSFVSHPVASADKLISDVHPVMQKYGFSDLNLDIEYTQDASAAARVHFTQFVSEVKKQLAPETTLTVEISPTEVISPQLIDIEAVGKIADYIVLMAYDYHSTDSYVTGPVAPLSGAGTISEYDVATAVEKMLPRIQSEKIILGVPLYGYEWETLGDVPRSAVLAGSGTIASNHRTEQLLAACASCSASFDTTSQEAYVIYKNQDIGTYQQIFYPDKKAIQAKIDFANQKGLGGLAFWALGYEGDTILSPVVKYLE